MSLIRADHFLPQFVPPTDLDGNTTFISKSEFLSGAASVTLQFVLSNGAAATCYVEGTNFETNDKNAKWQQCQSFTLAQNDSGSMVFSAVDQLTGMHAMRVRIVPTSPGKVQVAVNLRHYSH